MMFQVERLARPQLRAAAQALSNAFQSDPLYSFVVPNPRHRQRWLPVIKRELLRNTLPFGETYVATSKQGQILGALALTPPGKYPHPWWMHARLFCNVLLFPNPWCPTISKVWPIRRYAAVFDEIHYREPHWYIDTVGVDATCQRAGVGKSLLGRAIAQAEQSRLPIWLETQTAANVGYYQSFGFRTVIQKQPVPKGPPTWGMLRSA